jgi:predicted DNA-binding transcriptional regulator YafY
VSKRTIYRDLMALSESGIPLVAIPGQGYSLVEGYFLPPLTFTLDEAMMLLLGVNFVGQNFDTAYRRAAESANHKLVVALPAQLRQEIDYLESSIQFVTFNESSVPEITLQRLRQAIIEHKTVRFHYHARYHDEAVVRDVDPYALVHIGGAWMLTGHCHLRKDIRHFRLSRMADVIILNQSFTRPGNFKIQLSDQTERTVVVRVLFDPETAPRVRETPSLYQIAQEDHPEGLLVTLTVRQPEDILQWLLGWGSHVHVVEPRSLQDMVAHEAQKMVENYSKMLLT